MYLKPQQITFRLFKREVYTFFSFFGIHFLAAWIRIQLPDTDPVNQLNLDPIQIRDTGLRYLIE